MNIKEFSDKYDVYKFSEADVDKIYALCSGNPMYYEYCPPNVSREGIMKEMEILPEGKSLEDKYYVGFYENEKLIAIMDLIDGYPDKSIAFIGFFMTDQSVQAQGVGTEIIDYFCKHLGILGYKSARLVWVKGNPQAEHFWLKNQFVPIKETSSNVAEKAILAERVLV